MTETLKRRIRERSPVHVVNPNYPSLPLALSLLQLGFDAVFIDCEHGPWSPDQVAAVAAGVKAAGGTTFVRPEANVDWLVARYLNLGANGICVPRLDEPDQAARLARVIGEAGSCADIVALGILESRRGLEHLEALSAVDDMDGLMLGPVDLARSLGKSVADATVESVVTDTLARLRRLGKACGTRTTERNRERIEEAGATIFYWHANDLLASGAQALLAR